MKFRTDKENLSSRDEKDLTEDLRKNVAGAGARSVWAPADTYWPNLIVRTNQRIDEATSGKALSISWAARVAIPGVVAILSFLFGLHYYAPQQQNAQSTLTTVVLSLPDSTVDSLLSYPSVLSDAISVAEIGGDPFNISKEQFAEYYIEKGGTASLIEALTDKQVNEVLAALSTREK